MPCERPVTPRKLSQTMTFDGAERSRVRTLTLTLARTGSHGVRGYRRAWARMAKTEPTRVAPVGLYHGHHAYRYPIEMLASVISYVVHNDAECSR